MTIFVVESIDQSRQRKLFTLLGVDYCATSRVWLNPPLMVLIGIIIALIFAPTNQLLSQILAGLWVWFAGDDQQLLPRVNAPVKSILATATVYVTHYEDDEEQPSRVHLSRSLGGPGLNLLLGLTALAIYMLAVPNHFLLFFGIVNLGFGVFTLLPIPSLDGAVIWRELRDNEP
jgi:hypothetical protein